MINDVLLNAFAAGIKPEQKLSITEWAKRYVKLARSSRSTTADLNQTPWLIQPLETVLGNDATEVVINAPVGSGKSTMFEIIGTYIIAEKPGPALFATQTDADAQEWMQTGFLPALKGCPLIDGLWPKERNLIRRDFIQFPHMPVWVGGSNLSNFQSKSCDTVLIDEAWMLKKGLLEEARRRTHDRFNSKVVLVSQSGVVGDDFDLAYNRCFKHEFSYCCPSCEIFHPYSFDSLKWECDKTEDGEEIWQSVDVHYECPCGHTFKDNATDRRSMAESGRFIPSDSTNPEKGHIAFHYTALNVWWIPWAKLVIEFLKANQQKKKGNFAPLRQFLQKRLAKAWNETDLLEQEAISLSDYTLTEAKPWDLTILTADVQKQDIWFIVRTWTKGGESRLLEYGKVLTFGQLEEIQKKWSIKNNAVFLDSAYRVEEVKGALARYGWLGLNGRPESHYSITNKRTGKREKRIFSAPNIYKSSVGNAVITYYSSQGIKDVLFILKSGHGTRWEIPSDASEQYINMMNSEIKTLVDGKITYKRIKDDNHWLDCECEQIAAAMMHHHYPTITQTSED